MNFTQIKMIICDMDGTLLDNQKKLPPHFNQIYKELYDRNIIFAISSGRQMGEVKKYFEDNKTIYILWLKMVAIYNITERHYWQTT